MIQLISKKSIFFLPYILFLGLVIYVFYSAELFSDDNWFANISETESFIGFITDRYLTWSSRVGIESILYIICRHFRVWKVLTIIVYSTMFFLLLRMVVYTADSDISLSAHCIMVLLFSVFPLPLLNGTGWMATTINYLWPCTAFIVVVFVLFKLCIRKEPIKWYLFPLIIVIALFSVNSELVCIVMPMYLVYFGYRYFKEYKSIHSLIIVLTIIDFCGLINALVCPGNRLRTEVETHRWFPVFSELSLFTKLEIGFSSMMHYLNAPIRVLFMFMLICLTVAAVFTVKRKVIWLLSIVPMAVLGGFNLMTFDNLSNPQDSSIEYMYLSVGTMPSFSNPSSLVVDTLFIIQVTCILISLTAIFWDNKELLALVLITVLCGACSRMVMSFSPTVGVSGPRTFFILFICLSIVTMLLVIKLDSKNKVINPVLFWVLAITASCIIRSQMMST